MEYLSEEFKSELTAVRAEAAVQILSIHPPENVDEKLRAMADKFLKQLFNDEVQGGHRL